MSRGNPNHDPKTGEFSSGGGGGSAREEKLHHLAVKHATASETAVRLRTRANELQSKHNALQSRLRTERSDSSSTSKLGASEHRAAVAAERAVKASQIAERHRQKLIDAQVQSRNASALPPGTVSKSVFGRTRPFSSNFSDRTAADMSPSEREAARAASARRALARGAYANVDVARSAIPTRPHNTVGTSGIVGHHRHRKG